MIKIIIVLLLSFTSHSSYSKNLHAHVHGAVTIDIAVEKTKLLVMLSSPADSFLGFEYKAKSDEEKALVSMVKEEWEKNITNYLGKDVLADCKITKSKWVQTFSGKNHSNITAESYLNCSQRLTNRVLNLSFKEKHSPIHKIKVQYLKEDGSVFTKTFKDKIIKLKL